MALGQADIRHKDTRKVYTSWTRSIRGTGHMRNGSKGHGGMRRGGWQAHQGGYVLFHATGEQ